MKVEMAEYTERALRRISPVYAESSFMKYLFNGASASFETLRHCYESLREQRYIDTVTWAIACQELKYSLPVREDLTLEERRARLGLKAKKHFPLNPALLEKFLRETFGFESYLYEKDAGKIKVYFNYATPDSYAGSISWLLNEKPAHLILESALNLTEYLGGEGYNPGKIYPPDEPAPLDKSKPRLFAGVAQALHGTIGIKPAAPSNEKIRNTVSTIAAVSGSVAIESARPKHSIMKLSCKNMIKISGEITVGMLQERLIKENACAHLAIVGMAVAR